MYYVLFLGEDKKAINLIDFPDPPVDTADNKYLPISPDASDLIDQGIPFHRFSFDLGENGELVETLPSADSIQKAEDERLQGLRELQIQGLREECSRRIQTVNGEELNDTDWLKETQNIQDALGKYVRLYLIPVQHPPAEVVKECAEGLAILERKDAHRVRYRETRDRLGKMPQAALEKFDCTDDKHWAGL